MPVTYKKIIRFLKCKLSISRIVLIYDCAVYDGNY